MRVIMDNVEQMGDIILREENAIQRLLCNRDTTKHSFAIRHNIDNLFIFFLSFSLN